MDDLRMVRELYGEVPPDAQLQARVRARIADDSARGARRRRLSRGRASAGAGVVAAAAAAALGIATLGGGSIGDSPSAAPSALSARTILLAAAEKAEKQPVGKYWSNDVIQGQSYIIRAKTGTYAITGAHDETFGWWGAKPGMGEGYHGRDLPARPLTARDAALWRRAGAPSSFRVWSGDHYKTYTTKVAKWQSDGPERGTDARGGGKFDGKSVEDLQNLPTDPAKLAEMFLSPTEMGKAAGLPSGKRPQRMEPYAKIMRVTSLLGGAPIPPKVRAGLMRALVNQPGIRAIGHTTDPLGRRGVALATDARAITITGEFGEPKATQGTYHSRDLIIFDERTGALLSQQEELTRPGGPYAEMKPGFIINYSTDRSAKWTDTKPKPPAKLPF